MSNYKKLRSDGPITRLHSYPVHGMTGSERKILYLEAISRVNILGRCKNTGLRLRPIGFHQLTSTLQHLKVNMRVLTWDLSAGSWQSRKYVSCIGRRRARSRGEQILPLSRACSARQPSRRPMPSARRAPRVSHPCWRPAQWDALTIHGRDKQRAVRTYARPETQLSTVCAAARRSVLRWGASSQWRRPAPAAHAPTTADPAKDRAIRHSSLI